MKNKNTLKGFLLALIFLMEFSDAEKKVWIESDNEIKPIPEELVLAARRGDIKTLRRSLDSMVENNHEDFDEELLGYPMRERMFAVELLLGTKLAQVQTGNESRINSFRVTLYPGLVTPMFLTIGAIREWKEPDFRPIHVICTVPGVEPELVKVFLENGEDINARTSNPDPVSRKMTPLDFAAYHSNLPLAKFLVDNGADVNGSAMSLPDEVIGCEYYTFIKSYSQECCKVSSEQKVHTFPLNYAIGLKDTEMVKYLLRAGADVGMGGDGWVGLFTALKNEGNQILRTLLEGGARVNKTNFFGSTPLHVAADVGNFEGAKLLLEYGADVNAKDLFGWTPIHVASLSSRNDAILDLIVQQGANTEAKTGRGFKAMSLFLGRRYQKCFHQLFSSTFDKSSSKLCNEPSARVPHSMVAAILQVNHQDDVLGWTALHWAAAVDDLDLVKILVEKNANVGIESKAGLTPSELAKYFGNDKVVDYFSKLNNT